MNPWLAKAVILIASISIIMIIIRAPHGQRSRGIKVVKSRKGPLESALLTLAGLAFLVPLVWIATPLFAFADYPLRPIPHQVKDFISRATFGFLMAQLFPGAVAIFAPGFTYFALEHKADLEALGD